MSQVIGDPAQRQVPHDLSRDHEGGEHARLPGRRAEHGDRVHGIEPARHGPHRGAGARGEVPGEVRVAAEYRGYSPQLSAHRDDGRPRRRRRLPYRGERGVGDGHEHRAEEEAEAVAPRSRHRREQPRGDQAGAQSRHAGAHPREGEEAAAKRGGDGAGDHVHPGGHEHAARRRDDQQHGEEEDEREPGRGDGEGEGGRGQDQVRRPLPDRVPHDERELLRERLRVARHEEGRQVPADGHERGNGADHDVGRAEMRGEGGQDGGLAGERERDHEEPEVHAQREQIVAQVAADEGVRRVGSERGGGAGGDGHGKFRLPGYRNRARGPCLAGEIGPMIGGCCSPMRGSIP